MNGAMVREAIEGRKEVPVAGSFVKTKVLADPNYNPYFLRHAACGRMVKVEPMVWRCPRCGAEHDERIAPLSQAEHC